MERSQYEVQAMSFNNEMTPELNQFHAALGVTSEAGEIADIIKASLVYKKPFDLIHFVEELGDLSWFQALAIKNVGLTLEIIQKANIAKLSCRYGEGFSAAKALGRSKDLEREAIAKVLREHGIEGV